MEIAIYQIDAFTSRLFAGNPAAVCPLERWLPDEVMQAIAAENNLAETAFFVPKDGDAGRAAFGLRWFTPTVEVPLCGHATLATGFVIATILAPGTENMRFETRSGPLEVTRRGDLFVLDFPARPPEPVATPPALSAALGLAPREVLAASSYLAVFADEAEVAALAPDMAAIAALDRDGVIATAAGREVDFVSRYFAPAAGIPEDPVTGSAHCILTPYWAKRLGRSSLHARQISTRGGELFCEDHGARVTIAGRAVRYLEGRIFV
ncbi:PhzF family phenazine biosynthesis protein [Rhodospirillaceae bacterium SYSU D60014]|uniref:PhzF family phenazine biosynthesis protein n=1 Tax=Virgifigura deserti TaxID=2268457 RepID=UPI000E670417